MVPTLILPPPKLLEGLIKVCQKNETQMLEWLENAIILKLEDHVHAKLLNSRNHVHKTLILTFTSVFKFKYSGIFFLHLTYSRTENCPLKFPREPLRDFYCIFIEDFAQFIIIWKVLGHKC